MRARFFRIYAVPVVIQDKCERAELRVCLENEVDPLSGMTLNLTQVDALASQFQMQIIENSFGSGRSFFKEALGFWQQGLAHLKAELAELQSTGLSSPQGWLWQKGLKDPLATTRVWTQVRFKQSLREGWTEYLIPIADLRETSLPISQISVTVAGEKEIAASLAQFCPVAVRARFSDDATGESWGYKK